MNSQFAMPMQAGFQEQVSRVEEMAVNVQQGIQKKRNIPSARLNLCGRIVASVLLGVLTILVLAIASAGPAPRREVRVPQLDARAIENLQRWGSDQEESWCEDA